MKQNQACKKRRVWYIIGSIVFAAGMCIAMPKLIDMGSDFIFRKTHTPIRRKADDWGPEIVKKHTAEDTIGGEV